MFPPQRLLFSAQVLKQGPVPISPATTLGDLF